MMRWIVALLLSLWVGIAQAAVAVDATGTEAFLSAVTNASYSGSWTIGSGLSNSAAIVALAYASGGTTNATFSSPQLNGSAMTQIIQQNLAAGGSGVVLFGIIAPSSGAATFTVTSSITVDIYVYGVSFTGVNQTGGTTSFAHSAGTTASSTTCLANTITTANGNYTLSVASIGTGNGANTMQVGACGSGVTNQDWFDTTDPHSFGDFGAAGKVASSGTTTAWTTNNSLTDSAKIAGVDIVAAAVAATCIQTRMLTGVGC